MVKLLDIVVRVFLVVATLLLLGLAAYLVGFSAWELLRSVRSPDPTDHILGAISLIVIAFAVMELSKFVAEEGIERQRELRSAREARRSLTKFITIIVIALSLEALVMAFKASRGDIRNAIYPAALFMTAVFALIGLGLYQYLSDKVEPARPEERRPKAQE